MNSAGKEVYSKPVVKVEGLVSEKTLASLVTGPFDNAFNGVDIIIGVGQAS
ncbi:MAG: hypothetical protein AAGB04_02275 [Pseudomonadota bacterium]